MTDIPPAATSMHAVTGYLFTITPFAAPDGVITCVVCDVIGVPGEEFTPQHFGFDMTDETERFGILFVGNARKFHEQLGTFLDQHPEI